ncbi:MAG: ABC transporter permease [Deltaproteobacteria bacterium]|nr:ABC transporter permease [Deltaproteobacteria bacterium]MCL5791399.1 ABC transporter permease [Deltaproteobacteria bacterium]
MDKIFYFISTTIKRIKINLYLNIITVVTIAVALLILNIFFLIYINVHSVLGEWQGKINIIAYVKNGISADEIRQVSDRLRAISGVKGIKYYSQQEAFSEFKKELKGQSAILKGVSPDILPAYFVISLRDKAIAENRIDNVASSIKRLMGISDVQYGKELASKLSGVIILMKMLSIGIGGFIIFSILIIISNTIRISIFSKKDEIGILKLVGATNLFIEIPFILEGIVQITFGTGLSILLLYAIYEFFIYKLEGSMGVFFTNVSVIFLSREAIIAIFIGSILLGIAGSIITAGKFIRNAN